MKVALLSGWHVHAKEYGEGIGKAGGKLALVWDDDIKRGEQLAKELSVPFEQSLDIVLKNSEIEGVIVTTSTKDHVDIITKAANAKKHIFTEKVLAATVDECKEIKRALDMHNVKFCISLPHRTFKANLYIKSLIDNNSLGDVTYLRIRNAHGGSVQKWLPARFYNKDEACGGAMMDLGAHPMYLIRWFLGRPISVTSQFTEVSGNAIDDNCVSTFAYKNGAIAVSETGFVSPSSRYIVEVYGTKASVIATDGDVQLFNDGKWIKPDMSSLEDAPNALSTWVSGSIEFDYSAAQELSEMMEMAYKAHEKRLQYRFS